MRLKKIKRAMFEKPYIYYFFSSFLVFLVANFFINELAVTLPTILSVESHILVPFIFFNILVPILVAINVSLVVMKYKEVQVLSGKSGFAAVGAFGGLLAGACPGCVAGLFPAFLGIFGVTASLSNLPLHGIEIQAVSTVLLGVAIYFLTNKNVCKIK